jgi:RNA-directed DNA polymerase
MLLKPTNTADFRLDTEKELAVLLQVTAGELGHILSRLDHYYRRKIIPKANGKSRVLHIPRGRLKCIQTAIKTRILDRIPPLSCAHGGVKRRSIVTNAKPHVGRAALLALDIRDCFPSITPAKILSVFCELGFSGQAAKILTQLTTYKFGLPQGTPTSPSLANLALSHIDCRIKGLAAQQDFSYTRFVDDLAISGSLRLSKFQKLTHRIIESEGFGLKTQKELMVTGERHMVTKLVVNLKLNVSKARRSEIRKEAIEQVKARTVVSASSTRGKVVWLRSINA